MKDWPAHKAGIEIHDVVVAVDNYQLKRGADFVRFLSKKKAGEKLKWSFSTTASGRQSRPFYPSGVL